MGTGTWQLTETRTKRIENWAIHASRGALLALLVVFVGAGLTGTMPSLELQMVIYLVGMVGLNLPHGGYEHFENLRRRGLPMGAKYVAMYVTFVAGFIALFFVAPLLALSLAFATAVAKGGHGDLRVMDALVGSDHLESEPQRALAAFVRGGAVMIVPLLFWPETFYGFASYMVSMFDAGAVGALHGRMELMTPLLGGVYGLALLAHLVWGYVASGGSTEWLADVGETSLLVGYFAAVPVVISIGLYFPLWYSMRQSGRTFVANRKEPDDGQGLPVPVVWGVLIVGALATGLVAATLWFVAPNPLGTQGLLPGLVAFYTIFVCIVALPHVVVGEWLDFKRGIWYVP
ncbi:Brp/Blh family beta-carotene 15,15'-dioxygenase [Natronoarchaeum sp. GCM10025321]|uniref:Brp/Blh family beta-carotene 15,15'-dioxygenase n=1 Tax=Natronoarchaeum sp. GCM10025321 TaxID=3252684 RepID=UPI00360FEABF